LIKINKSIKQQMSKRIMWCWRHRNTLHFSICSKRKL